jgi:hypothetical protein
MWPFLRGTGIETINRCPHAHRIRLETLWTCDAAGRKTNEVVLLLQLELVCSGLYFMMSAPNASAAFDWSNGVSPIKLTIVLHEDGF